MINTHPELIKPAVSTLASAFQTDAIVAYMLNGLKDAEARSAYIPTLFNSFLTASILNGGWLIHTPKTADGELGACALVLPPGADPANPWTMYAAGALGLIWNLGWSGVERIMTDYAGSADECKQRAMGTDAEGKPKEKERYYYVFIIGARPEERGKGLGSALMEEVKRVCKEDGNASCWLESTSTGSRDLYNRLGWRITEEVTIGKGKAGANGLPKVDGDGVKYWAMLYRPAEEEAVIAAAKEEQAARKAL